MNERIKELAKQAVLQANEVFDQKGKDYLKIVMEKFAELIVRECDMVIKDAVSTMERGKLRASIARAGTLIKEHFGVEE